MLIGLRVLATELPTLSLKRSSEFSSANQTFIFMPATVRTALEAFCFLEALFSGCPSVLVMRDVLLISFNIGLKWQLRFVCGWQVKLCDP